MTETQKPASIKQDEWWARLETALIGLLCLTVGITFFLYVELPGVLFEVGLTALAVATVAFIAMQWGLGLAIPLAGILTVAAVVASTAVNYDPLPAHERLRLSLVPPTPVAAGTMRDWADWHARCVESRGCWPMTTEYVLITINGAEISTTADGTLKWPVDLSDTDAATAICDRRVYGGAWDFETYAERLVAVRAARPSFSDALKMECGL